MLIKFAPVAPCNFQKPTFYLTKEEIQGNVDPRVAKNERFNKSVCSPAHSTRSTRVETSNNNPLKECT